MTFTAFADWARSPDGRQKVRYSVASLVSVVVGQAVLAVAFGAVGWSARSSNVVALCVAAIPSYYLNRAWVWQRRGRSDLFREVVPFWCIAFLGLAVSTWAVDTAEHETSGVDSRLVRTMAIMAASMIAFSFVWVAKFLAINRYLFGAGSNPDDARNREEP